MTIQEKVNKIKYPIAKNHQYIQILPQFKPIKRGARKKGIERIYTSPDGKKIAKIRMWKELDIADQDLLLTILAIALPVERGLLLKKEEEKYKKLWEDLNTKGILANYDTIFIKTTLYELAKELGRTLSKTTYQWIKDSLERLTGTHIIIETEEHFYGTNLISFNLNKKDNKIEIAINPLNALVLLNDNKGYILHNRKERILLKGDVSKALHAVLVGLVNPKSSKILKLDVLVEKVYLKKIKEMSSQEKKDSRKAIRKAIKKFNLLKNWKITIYDNDTFKIERL